MQPGLGSRLKNKQKMTGTILKMASMMKLFNKRKYMRHKRQKIWSLRFNIDLWDINQNRIFRLKEETKSIQNGKKISSSILVYSKFPVLTTRMKTIRKTE